MPIPKASQKNYVSNFVPYLYFPLWRRCLNVASMINLSFMCQANFIIFNLDSLVFWRKSTTSQLLQVSNEIGKSLDQRIHTDILYLDFSKAFDKVDQGLWKPIKLVHGFKTTLQIVIRESSSVRHRDQPPPPPPRAIRCSPGFDPWFSAVSYVRERPTSTYHDIVCSTVS